MPRRTKLARQNEWQRGATLRELSLTPALRHPFVVRCVDAWIDKGHTVYTVLEYCQQGDLQEVQKKRNVSDEHRPPMVGLKALPFPAYAAQPSLSDCAVY